MSLHFFLDFPWLVWFCCILECSASIIFIGLKFGWKAQTNWVTLFCLKTMNYHKHILQLVPLLVFLDRNSANWSKISKNMAWSANTKDIPAQNLNKSPSLTSHTARDSPAIFAKDLRIPQAYTYISCIACLPNFACNLDLLNNIIS